MSELTDINNAIFVTLLFTFKLLLGRFLILFITERIIDGVNLFFNFDSIGLLVVIFRNFPFFQINGAF